MAGIGAPELMIVLVIILVIFGGAKLPKLAKSLGEARREFERETSDGSTHRGVAPGADPLDRAVLDAQIDAENRAAIAEREAEVARREADLLRREAEVRNQGN